MEHRFTGPSYTLGVEEELMIVDEETLDLTNSIESLLSDLAEGGSTGDVKPELMESVCEIATTPSDDIDATRRGVDASTIPSKIRCLASAIVAVWSASGAPSIPNIFFWKEPRWSNARM